MEAEVLKRLFTLDEFHQMTEAGVFRDDDRLELLDGEIVRMTPIGSPHAGCVMRLNEWFTYRVQARAIVSVQGPLDVDETTEFYPDLALLKRRPDFYTQSHPGPGDVLLVIEVADTTGHHDRKVKVPHYARAGVPEVWVVDVNENVVDAYSRPSRGEYRGHRRVRAGESLAISGVGDHEIAVSEILNPKQ